MAIAERPLTLEKFLKLPEKKPALEYEDGVVTQKVSPKGPHSTLQAKLAQWFNQFAEPLKLAFAFPELRVTFGGVSRVPDLAVYLWERIPRTSTGRVAYDFFEPPDIVVEIASPRQSANSLVRRCLWFVEHGVRIALLVDPEDESVIAFRPVSRERALRGADRIDVADVLPGFQLTVGELFASLNME